MAIEQLLRHTSVERFLTEHYHRVPFSCPGGCAHLGHLGDPAVADHILSQRGVDVIIGSCAELAELPAPTQSAELQALLSRGVTVGIRHAERHHPILRELAEGFEHDFAAPVDIHLYYTGAGARGFGWHYDAEDVFILQVRGTKDWLTRKNTVQPWPVRESLPRDMHFEREITPLWRCELMTGDWLYLPAGYWHSGQAREASVSISMGLASPTALSVLDFLRRRLVTSLMWRQRLPVTGAASSTPHAELETSFRELFAMLAADLDRELRDDRCLFDFLSIQDCVNRPAATLTPSASLQTVDVHGTSASHAS